MAYKTNYEPYISQPTSPTSPTSQTSFDFMERAPSVEVLSPLRTLYPHVAALQVQNDANAGYFTGYHNTSYWADAYTTQPSIEDYSRPMSRRNSENSTTTRFVSKIRRILCRDDERRRMNST